ncbi:MAG: hypothetical protein C0631_14445 [Sedimenticola sp.]|jgi:HSP20 family protein|nr:MAG: hypothetical protein C0631_14445 [Sedimenticola sp.]
MAHLATNHWSMLDDMDREIRRFLGSAKVNGSNGNAWMPAVDILEEDDKYVLVTDIPGVDPDTIEVSMEDNVLTVSGKRDTTAVQEKIGYHRRERLSGEFKRSFRLPETVLAEAITATGKFGVLEIVIPKKPVEQPRRIPVTH